MSEILEMLIPAVEEQIASEQTAYVKETLSRLLEQPDLDEAEAKKMIAVCLADEMERMVLESTAFDEDRYRTMLAMLPVMPE